MSSLIGNVGSLSTGLSTINSTVANAGAGVAAALGGGAAYDAATGTVSAPSYTVYKTDGTTDAAPSVASAIDAINAQGTKYAHTNSTLGGSQATGSDSVAIGPQAVASGASAVALGSGAQATGTNAIAVGTGALATGSVAVGVNSRAGGGGTAIGDNADAGGTPLSKAPAVAQGTAVGFGALVQTNGGVALGSGSVSSTGPGVAGFVGAGATPAQAAAVAATTSTQGAVAVGDPASGQYRQVTGVAAGAADSDAVNVSQLKATNADVSQITNQFNNLSNQVNVLQRNIAEVSHVAYSGIAMAFAMSGAYMPAMEPGEKAVGVGVGGYQGYGAVALLFKAVSPDGKMGWGAGVSSTGSQWGINAGIGWKWR
ncbi:YadA-like family protein [Variovorax sp. J22R133]|uniref:YadA-like family protein n=1 Tax=Variovorax brevis TaxID=3053503 RepID=UPI0025777C47|nr:YadA-like family protein [Variovorax sp. J22R133]MDM0113024.1 YadA-like family protein [Variovorax sp. J22R133]